MRSLVRYVIVAGGIVSFGIQNASAQIFEAVEFTTSFPFTVGSATMPAGRYTIRPDDDNPEILELTGARASVFFQTESAQIDETPSKTEVVFKRYRDRYVLKNIWLEGSTTGAEAIAAEGERHMSSRQEPDADQRVAAKKKVDTTKNR